MSHRAFNRASVALAAALALGVACSAPSRQADQIRDTANGEGASGTSQQLTDAGITARIKTTYLFNEHLNSFRINVDTEGGVVSLNGTVKSDIQKDLAREIAVNAPGVVEVRNDLQVTEGEVQDPEETERTFTQAVSDATVTASVKTALAFEKGVKAHEINVDTHWGTVSLSGTVGTAAERELAEKTAEDVAGVEKVVNDLEVAS